MLQRMGLELDENKMYYDNIINNALILLISNDGFIKTILKAPITITNFKILCNNT